MAFINENTLQEFSYAGPNFHAPQIFREKIFARTHLTVSLCLDDYLFFLAEDYLVIFPSFFLRFNEDQTISFLEDPYIQRYRNRIFGIPLHLVSDIAADEETPKLHPRRVPQGRILPGGEALRPDSEAARSIPELEKVSGILGCVKIEMNGTVYALSTKNSEKYNRIFYHSPDYTATVNHFNLCVQQYHRELEDLVAKGILFPVRELKKQRDSRREAIRKELTRLQGEISAVEEEQKSEKFSLSPLRRREAALLKKQREEFLQKQQEQLDLYRTL